MQENEIQQSITPQEETAESIQEQQTEQREPMPEQPKLAQEKRQTEPKKLFSLKYKIPLEEYYKFHLFMGQESVKKNQKRTRLLGWIEVAVGIALIIGMIVNRADGGIFYLVLAALMILMGLYGALYYSLLYPRALRRAVTRQHKSTPYLQHEILVDFYQNRCTEYVAGNHADTFWHEIKDLRETEALYLVMLAERRCLLIPKSQLNEKENKRMDELLDMISQNYEKRRVRV